MEYLEKHPNSDVRRLPINLKLLKDNKLTITHVDPKKENRRRRMKKDKKDEDDKENETIGYQQIVIFDYETRKITFYLNAALKARVISNSNGSNETKVQICFALFNILCLGLTILVISNHSIQYIC